MPIYFFKELIGKGLKSVKIHSYENPWWEFEVIVAVVQPIFSIVNHLTKIAKRE